MLPAGDLRASPAVPRTDRVGASDLVFLWWCALVPIGLSWGLFNKDGDLPRHLTAGAWMLDHRALLDTYPFSYLRPGSRFVPFEWLSDVLLAAAYRLGGLGAVAIGCGLVIALTYALLTRFLLRRGVHVTLAIATGLASAALGVLFWRARPHLFTMLGVVLLLHLLERPPGGRRWPYIPLFAVWGNLHGGFVCGWIIIGAYLVGSLLELPASADRATWRARVVDHAAALALSIGAVLINPHGATLVTHVLGFFGQRTVVDRTNEFLSPDFHLWHNQVFLAVLIVILAGLARSTRRLELPRLLALLASLAFALYSVRNVQLFGLIALPLAAIHLDPDWRRAARRLLGSRSDRVTRPNPHEGVGAALGAGLMCALALTGGRVASAQLVPTEFDSEVFPIGAVSHARNACLDGRLFNRLNWGGYIAFAWPGQQVFIDGATEFFGDSLFQEYMKLTDLQPGWRQVLTAHDIGLVIVPSSSALASELPREPGWQTEYRDSTAVVLHRASSKAACSAS